MITVLFLKSTLLPFNQLDCQLNLFINHLRKPLEFTNSNNSTQLCYISWINLFVSQEGDVELEVYCIAFICWATSQRLKREYINKKTCFLANHICRQKKRECFWIFLIFWNRQIKTKLFPFLKKYIISSTIFIWNKTCFFRLIIFRRPKKRVFWKNNFSLHLILSMRNFFVITLFS